MAKLYFYYSAMNAGKTTNLLQSAHNYRERGMRTLILTPRLDDRGGRGGHGQRCQQQQPGHPPPQARGLLGRVGRRHGDGVLWVARAAIGGGCQSYALAGAA